MTSPELFSDSLTFAHVVSALRAAGCVFAEEEARLLLSEAISTPELAEWLDRRVTGEPLEYILGWAEFCGLRIAVDPGVFVPRRRTGLLVSEAVTLLQEGRTTVGLTTVDHTTVDHTTVGFTTEALSDPAGPPVTAGTPPLPQSPPTPSRVVVDLCCGSGAVGVAIASRASGVELHAADIDPVAVSCGRRNVTRAGGQIYQGDLYSALPAKIRGRVRLVAVNAPYVPTGALQTMPPEARNYEPRVSLDGGADGLDLHRRVIAEAADWLAPDGHLLIETSERQAAETALLVAAAGFAAWTVHSEELDGTVVIGAAPQTGLLSPGHLLS